MINRDVILAGCRAYADATYRSQEARDTATVALATGEGPVGRALLAAIAAAVDADRSDWDAVTSQYK